MHFRHIFGFHVLIDNTFSGFHECCLDGLKVDGVFVGGSFFIEIQQWRSTIANPFGDAIGAGFGGRVLAGKKETKKE